APLERSSGTEGKGPYRYMQAVQELMQEKAGIIRTEELLGEARDDLRALKAEAEQIGMAGNR
ncbi:MAG: hypothetical protein GWN46_01045, partial [Gammaproteobacteria bacterium]|nr:hypothetical protein [Gammaproteobacteria bacterium]